MIRAATIILVLAGAAGAQVPPSSYRVETVATPEGIAPEVSAICFAPDGRLVACFRLGSIWMLDTESREWTRFATGLFWPLGIIPGEPGEFFVAQAPELTRIRDTDGDGVADFFETVSDGWGLAGNYHEFVAGPVRDASGDFFVAVGCVSSGGPVRRPFRGPESTLKRESKVYGHHSPVPYRGWVLKIARDGALTPFASGFRQPNGLVLDDEGELFAVDNQGDWVGTSPLHHVTKGAFHGHPASLVWESSIDRHPEKIPVEELARMRKPPAVLFPQNDIAGSIAQPVVDRTGGKFGPYSGQLLVAEWSHERVHRVALERVDGVYQGACFPFFEGRGLRRGSNRLAFGPDGSLWIGQVSRVWGGTGEGLQRLSWTGETPMDILRMRLLEDGFELTFTLPVDPGTAASPAAYSLKRYHYLYHATYGSPKQDVTPVSVRGVTVSDDALRVTLRVDEIVAGRVYDLRPRGIRSRDGAPLATRMAAYTVNRPRAAK